MSATDSFHERRFDDLDARTLYDILRLRVDVFVVEQGCAFGDLDGRDVEPSCRHLWIERDGEVIACARLLDENGGATQIGRVVTRIGVRGDGVGARMMREALARIDGVAVLKAQARLSGWYAQFGFQTCGPTFYEDDILHVPMRRGAHEPDQTDETDRTDRTDQAERSRNAGAESVAR